MRDVALQYPSVFVRSFRGLFAYRFLTMLPRHHLTRGIVYWGPTGSGKSKHAFELWPDAYPISMSNLSSSGSSWFDGYDGQETVIVEDFNGFFRLNLFLNLIDRYPFQVQTKGGFCHFVAKIVIFTSNTDPAHWYKEAREKHPNIEAAFQRRLIEYMDVFFVGYGPNMDKKYCQCLLKTCQRQHKPPPTASASAAFARGYTPASRLKRKFNSN
jgi:hypothetical protein